MRKRLSPGVILGIVAVVFAGTGSATAGVLITSGKIKDGTIQGRDIKKGTITSDKLSKGVRRELLKVGKPGATGAKGDTGATGATGPAGGTTTVQGSAPQQGAAGKDGANPATLVASSGDQGWALTGGSSSSTDDPPASLTGGALHLQGGFDNTTVAGAIGLSHAYTATTSPLLNTLKALSYDFTMSKRRDQSEEAPSIHVAVLNASSPTAADPNHTSFTNFVFEPYMQKTSTNGLVFDLDKTYSMNAMTGRWWSTSKVGNCIDPTSADCIQQSNPVTWDRIVALNPKANIINISVDNGNTSGPNKVLGPEFAADVDNLVVGFGSTFTRFDLGG